MIIFFERAGYYIIEKKDNTELSEKVFTDFVNTLMSHDMFDEELIEVDEYSLGYPIPKIVAKVIVMKSIILSMISTIKNHYNDTIDMFEEEDV